MQALHLQRLQAAFEANIASGCEVGAAVSVWRGEGALCDLCDGFRDAERTVRWTPDTIVLVWSATKGLAASCVLQVIDEAGLGLDDRVAGIWPDFGASGKSAITLRDVLSHCAGLAVMSDQTASILDHAAVAAALAAQPPVPEIQGRVAYGPRTSGFLMDEIVRRIRGGETIGAAWRRLFADPLGLDVWIGLPDREFSRVATMIPGRSAGSPQDEFFRAFMDRESLTRRAFSAPTGLAAVSAMNRPDIRRASIPSLGGIASAAGLAKFYSVIAADGWFGTQRLISARVIDWMRTPLASGFDPVLRRDVAFSAGLMMDPVDADGAKKRPLMGPSLRACGHPGAGGSLAFADPDAGIGFAYVMNQMEADVLPGARARSLVSALYGLPRF